MFNNTALDIAIGFIFILLLYSLLSTTIKESIASIFAHRSRMLERAIEQMTDGKNVRYFWWDKVINFFFWISHTVNVSQFNKKMKNEDPEHSTSSRTTVFSWPTYPPPKPLMKWKAS
jgi:hypothetical protein